MKVFLDDMRDPKDCLTYMHKRIGKYNLWYLEDWKVVRTPDEFKKVIMANATNIECVSFDHDLAEEHYSFAQGEDEWSEYHTYSDREETGYDCAKWMKEYYLGKGFKLPKIIAHTMNIVGVAKILNLFTRNN